MVSTYPNIEGGSKNRPPFFNGEAYSYWRDRMRIHVQGIAFEIWETIENGPFIPTYLVNDKVVEKPRSMWTEDEKRTVQYSLKAKNIITSALSYDEFHRVSDCDTAKEMWDTLQETHEGTSEVKRARMNTLNREYELFRMEPNESIKNMQTRFIHIKNNLRTLGKTFSNEDMINKVLRCLDRNWQPKVTAISESRNLATMSLSTLFGKLQEHELELKRLNENETTDKQKKSIALKATTKEASDDSSEESDEDMSLMVRKFKKFMKYKGKPKHSSSSSSTNTFQKKNQDSSTPTCYNCGERGHIKPDCPQNQRRDKKGDRRFQKNQKGKRAYIAWEENDSDTSNSDAEEANLCLMAKHEEEDEEEVSYQDSDFSLSYDELLIACEELNYKTIKLAKIASSSKKTISSLESQIKSLLEENQSLKEKQNELQKSFTSTISEIKNDVIESKKDTNFVKKNDSSECQECPILKSKNDDLLNTLSKFTKGRDNLNILLGNQTGTFGKAGLGYEPTLNEKSFTFPTRNKSTTSPFIKCFHCGRLGHTGSTCKIRNNTSFDGKKVWIPKGSIPPTQRSISPTNFSGPKKIWVPKVKN